MRIKKLLCVLFTMFMITLSSCNFFGPIKASNREKEIRHKVITMFEEFDVFAENILVEEVELDGANCTRRFTVENDNIYGAAYPCTIDGYKGDIEFIISFANGNYLSFSKIGKSRLSSNASKAIKKITKEIKNFDANEVLVENDEFIDLVSGCSITGYDIAETIEVCKQDYLELYYYFN